MAGKPSPITPSVLAWALSEDGRPLVDVAIELQVEESTLDEWIHGEAMPTVGQVTALATVLRRPRAMFFLPGPPEQATLPASFRHPPGDDRQVSPASRRSVRQARQVQTVIADALADQAPVALPRFSAQSSSPEGAAAAVRDWLGISDSTQAAWTSDYEAMHAWRAALEARGIFVFSLEIGEVVHRKRPRAAGSGPDVRGFSAWDDHAPMIVMNSRRVNAAARSFTMAHELGHLVTRLDAACVDTSIGPDFREPTERWCEEFGAAFLMPRERVLAFARVQGIRTLSGDIEDVAAMMRAFRVSARAAALRLIDLGLAPRSLYPAVEAVFRPAEAPAGAAARTGSDPRSTLRLRQFGPRALEAVFRGVDPMEALSILRITVPDARALAAQVPSAAVV